MAPDTVIAERYRLIRMIGEGGMGEVWEAEHITVGRRVAIKMLHANFVKKEGVVERFEREARAAGAIGHDHIVDVIDFGSHNDAPFMVLEYLRGESLGGRLERERKLPLDVACAIMGQVLSALSAAHAAGIVHRDLKPDNVFLTSRGQQRDFVKLLDFGISKFADSTKSLTKTGTLMGTPQYMSPEQARARPDVDDRADVYSAGAMLYEMLTGSLPFDAENETDILIKICQRDAEPIPPELLEPSIPPELDAVVRRAIAFSREDRFQSAAEMLDALRPFGASGDAIVDPSLESRRTIPPMGNSTPTAWMTPTQNRTRPPTIVPPAAVSTLGATLIAPPGGRARVTTIAFAIASAALLSSAGLLLQRRPRSDAATAVTAASTQPAGVARGIQIDVSGIPATGRLLVDGHETAQRSLLFQQGTRHNFRVEAPGFVPLETQVEASRNQSLNLTLTTVEPVVRPVAPPAVAVAPVAPPTPIAVVQVVPRGRPAQPVRPRAPVAGAHPSTGTSRPAGSLLPATAEY